MTATFARRNALYLTAAALTAAFGVVALIAGGGLAVCVACNAGAMRWLTYCR